MKTIFFKKTQVKKTKTLLLCFFVSQLAAHPPGAFRSPCCEPNRWFKNQHAGSFKRLLTGFFLLPSNSLISEYLLA